MYEHHILNYFCLFQVKIFIFRFNLINYFEKLNNMEEFEHSEYICDKIIFVQSLKKWTKLGLWMKFLGEFFYGVWYW
jgi:hypothetical protein